MQRDCRRRLLRLPDDRARGARPTTGVIGALGCEPPGDEILPHEQTIPKDKTDRLDLLRACHANLSPIWGLSLTAGLCEIVRAGRVRRDGRGDRRRRGGPRPVGGRRSRSPIEAISAGVALGPGHRRRSPPLPDRPDVPGRTTRRAGDGPAGDYDFVMAFVVELSGGPAVGGSDPPHRFGTGGRHRSGRRSCASGSTPCTWVRPRSRCRRRGRVGGAGARDGRRGVAAHAARDVHGGRRPISTRAWSRWSSTPSPEPR